LTNRRHLVIPGIIVAVLSVIWDLMVALVLNIPPGYATTTAADQTVTSQVFAIIAGDVGMAVVVFGLYFAIQFSRRGSVVDYGVASRARSNVPLQAAWIGSSFVLVMFAAGFGVVELEGQTAPSLVVPASALAAGAQHDPLIVQVIGQQWQFTYRYPQYGGFETQQLRIPTDRLVQFDVTSIDVTHSFWAYQLGIKLDANQGSNNVGYVYVTKPTLINVRCGELCGLFHGYMTNVGDQAGQALSPSDFSSWLSYAEATYGPEAKNLPRFALVYYPQPLIFGS
jgi:cytochrome c oxidase subunit 2